MNKGIAVKNSQLGNCWSPRRFIPGHRCDRILHCKYPERQKCQALVAEITFVNDHRDQRIAEIEASTKRALVSLGKSE